MPCPRGIAAKLGDPQLDPRRHCIPSEATPRLHPIATWPDPTEFSEIPTYWAQRNNFRFARHSGAIRISPLFRGS